jgi:DNA polymerase-3 subunit epsilon
MRPAVFYDSETNGIPLFKEPSNDPRQPHIVQLAGILVDLDTEKTINQFCHIIKPDGWEIPDEVVAIHGITYERAMDEGVPEIDALCALLGMISENTRIGHNESFDARIMRIAIKRYMGDDHADIWKAGPAECTARLTRGNFSKMPTLMEAHVHYYGREFQNPHNALNDAMACRDVYFGYQRVGK